MTRFRKSYWTWKIWGLEL